MAVEPAIGPVLVEASVLHSLQDPFPFGSVLREKCRTFPGVSVCRPSRAWRQPPPTEQPILCPIRQKGRRLPGLISNCMRRHDGIATRASALDLRLSLRGRRPDFAKAVSECVPERDLIGVQGQGRPRRLLRIFTRGKSSGDNRGRLVGEAGR
jgi:hypothetical protein